MTRNLLKLTTRYGKAVILLGLFASSLTVSAQTLGQDQKASVNPNDPEKEQISIVEEENRAKRLIKEADKEYQENLDRARDLSSLGAALVTSFKEKRALNDDDLKKLDKVEKLAKGIRRAAGGSEDKVEMDKPPQDLPAAMQMLGDLSQSIKDKVEKTPKHVISACVIDEANVLLELIRIVRTLPAKV